MVNKVSHWHIENDIKWMKHGWVSVDTVRQTQHDVTLDTRPFDVLSTCTPCGIFNYATFGVKPYKR